MKYSALLFLLTITLSSCKKTVEKAQQDALITVMTNGRWIVTSYTKGGTDVTANFNGYEFQFKENKTVEAIKNNRVEKTGTWDGNAFTRTIISNFLNAVQPLALLNGSFYIDDSSLTTVDASQTVNGEVRTLKLKKL